MARITIMTVADLRKAIADCKEVQADLRFGVFDSRVKLSKKEAFFVASTMKDSDTPKHMEMPTGQFGTLVDGILYLG